MSRVTTVFFDAGHTLLHAFPSVPEIYAAEAGKFGAPVAAEEISAAWPPIWKEFTRRYAADPANGAASEAQDRSMWRFLVRELADTVPSLKPVAFEPWFDRLYTMFGTAAVWRLYDDTLPTLQALRREGLRIAIISNWDARLRRIATELKLDECVDFSVISAECGARKPDPRIFELALRQANVRPEEAIHVGDLYDEDIAGARRSGIGAVLLDRHGHGAPRHSEGEFHVVRRLDDVIELARSPRRTAP